QPSCSTLFPYTTLFRSASSRGRRGEDPGDLAVVQGDDMGVLADAPDQSGKDLTGTDLEKFRATSGDHLDHGGCPLDRLQDVVGQDRKSTRLNSSHRTIS